MRPGQTRGFAVIRILLSLAVAAAAYYGPWFVESAVGARSGAVELVRTGAYYAGDTVVCATGGTFSLSGACAPSQGAEGMLVAAAILLGLGSAALNVLGLLPFIGRATSIVSIVAGFVAVGALLMVGWGVMQTPGMDLGALRWGAFATGGFGVLLLVAGIAGLRGDDRD
jgi:hypothetical protein